MDFGNYTIGSLVPKRGNYDYDNPEYKKVYANIIWRLYDLGYDHSLFEAIDRQIAWYHSIPRDDGVGKVERYGKKYSWIAFFEIAGYRQDNLQLPEQCIDEGRIPEADIDPSFPEAPLNNKIVEIDYLGDRSIDLSKWIESGDGAVDISPYIVLEKINGTKGPWVLIDGDINQEDLNCKRACFILIQGFLVKRKDAKKIVYCLNEQPDFRQSLPQRFSTPSDHYAYAGEIPWCETFHYNEFETMNFIVGRTKNRLRLRKSPDCPMGPYCPRNSYSIY